MTEPQPNSILNTSTGHHERLVTSLIALENFLAEIRAAADREEIMALTLVDLRSLIPILTAGFYFPRPEGFDFALHTRLEPAEAERLNGLVDQAIDSGVFGWALKHSRPAAFKTRDGKNTLLLAALRTRQRLLGMFAALVGPQSAVEWDASTLVLATHLACAADAMLTDDLTLELQNQNRRLDSLVAQRTQQLLEAKEAAELANRAKSSFLATISHELRTPLNAILGYTQILLGNDLAAEDPRESIQTIHASAEHLLALINDLLDLSKVEASAIEIFPQPVALHRLIRETADLVRPRVAGRPILFQCTVQAGLPREVVVYPRRLRQILLNLLSNALKFTENGSIHLKVSRAPRGIRFAVTDTGCGIAAQDLPRLFQPFQQFGNTLRRGEGTGLGLSISKKILEVMGGELHGASELKRGTTFWFDLPCKDAAADLESEASVVSFGAAPADPAAPASLPPEAVRTLSRLAGTGDVQALEAELNRIIAQIPSAKPLASKLLNLVLACRIKAVRDILRQYE